MSQRLDVFMHVWDIIDHSWQSTTIISHREPLHNYNQPLTGCHSSPFSASGWSSGMLRSMDRLTCNWRRRCVGERSTMNQRLSMVNDGMMRINMMVYGWWWLRLVHRTAWILIGEWCCLLMVDGDGSVHPLPVWQTCKTFERSLTVHLPVVR